MRYRDVPPPHEVWVRPPRAASSGARRYWKILSWPGIHGGFTHPEPTALRTRFADRVSGPAMIGQNSYSKDLSRIFAAPYRALITDRIAGVRGRCLE